MGKTRHMHQYFGARLLHELYAARGGRGFLQQGGDVVQDLTVLHLVVQRWYRAELDDDLHVGGYTGGPESAERCHCRDPV